MELFGITASFLFPTLLIVLLLLLVYVILKNYQNRRNFPPSPPKLPIIGNLHQLKKPPHRALHNLSQKYGPVMLLQLGSIPTLVVSSAEAAKEVLKTRDSDFCTRPPLATPKRLSYNYVDIGFAPYGEYWRDVRKICVNEVFSVKRVQSFSAVRAEEVAALVDSMSRSSSTSRGALINVYQKFICLTDQVACRVSFGKNYHQQHTNDNDENLPVELKQAFNELGVVLQSFSASDLFPKVGWIVDRITGFHGRVEKCFHSLDKFFQQVLDEHLDPNKPKPDYEDVIDVLLNVEKDSRLSNGRRLMSDNIKAIIMNLYIAGADTSAITMSWAMAELIRNPQAMEKVQEEVISYVGKNKEKVEETDLQHFPYLKMVVNETLRLHPPAPLLIPRECMVNSTVGGYDVKRKTRVIINAWAIGRNPAYWEKPNEFYPERFVDNSMDIRGMQNFEFLPFGGGRRGCPGIHMGLVMVELALANLLYCFNWELPGGMNKEDVNMEETSGLANRMKYPVHLVPVKV
ncbi:cytochrome P450 71B36-like [Papaver somniferum]|uniref:cytochrome P450 71B36-like n=1 Tax=Papaver somniferum TaxID=3469 RepID=UPI000E701C23|nr:cytochrome P450 71B36-like [Papaver somniferum]